MTTRQHEIRASGSYGCGEYAGRSTFGLDFATPGSYGRGEYAGRSTFDLDFATPGSYGRGEYAGRSTFDLDWRRRDDFARGGRIETMRAPIARPEPQERPASAD